MKKKKQGDGKGGTNVNPEVFKKYKSNKKELNSVVQSIDKLQEQLEEVPVVSGKVTKSSDDFPYIDEHMSVKIADPRIADPIKKMIRMQKIRMKQLRQDIYAVDSYIDGMPDGLKKRIFEMFYLEGTSQNDIAETTGYTQGRISQIIKEHLKD